MKPIKNLLIVGYGRCGKDCAGAILGEMSTLRYACSTSWVAKEMISIRLGISTQLAWETRHERRMEWYKLCNEFRQIDPCILITRALGTGEIVAGVRDIVEITAARERHIFDRIVWIHRPETPVDPTVTFGPEFADEVIQNDGDLAKFRATLYDATARWGIRRPVVNSITAPSADLLRE